MAQQTQAACFPCLYWLYSYTSLVSWINYLGGSHKKATNNQSLPEPPMTEVWSLHVRLSNKVTFHWRCKSPFRNKDLLSLWLVEKQDYEKHFLITAKLTNRLSLVLSSFNRMSRCVHVIACEWYMYDIYEFLKRKFFWKITIKLELRAFPL